MCFSFAVLSVSLQEKESVTDPESFRPIYLQVTDANERRVQQRKCSRWLKRTIDISGACFGIALCLPLLVFVMIIVKCAGPGPILFCQRRVGLRGATFVMYKFRTMFETAESRLPEIQDLIEWDGPIFRVKDDPRVTRIGKWLRQFRIDELPQLFNVLAGDMSLVGPRPHLPEEVARYDLWHYKRLACKPGITGLSQIKRRHDLSSEDSIKLDLSYIAKQSPWLDLQVLVMTIVVVLCGR